MIVVIADDLTGAAEVAGAAHLLGLTAEVHIDKLLPSDCDVLIVDANSRSCAAASAADIVREITCQALQAEPELLFKKVDSVLRGPVAAELKAMRLALGASRTFLVNANPRKGRTVIGGCLAIDGQPLELTTFASDPEHPRTTSRIVDLLCVSASQIAFVAPGDKLPAAEICVGLASHESDLLAHAQSFYGGQLGGQQAQQTLLAGGGEFFEALLCALVKKSPERPMPAPVAILRIDPDTLLIGGSSNCSASAWPHVTFNWLAKPSEVASEVRCEMMRSGHVALRGSQDFTGGAETRTAKLTAVAREACLSCRPQHVWIEGGRTASQLVRALGYQRLTTTAVHGDGVVRLAVAGQVAPSLILKPGSYGWPIALAQAPANVEVA